MEQQHGKPDHDPDEVVELDGLADLDAEKFRTGDAENAVRAAGQAEHVVDQGDADDFHDADGHDEQVVAAQVMMGRATISANSAAAAPATGMSSRMGIW